MNTDASLASIDADMSIEAALEGALVRRIPKAAVINEVAFVPVPYFYPPAGGKRAFAAQRMERYAALFQQRRPGVTVQRPCHASIESFVTMGVVSVCEGALAGSLFLDDPRDRAAVPVSLNTADVPGAHFYNGQIVALEVVNPNGNELIALRVLGKIEDSPADTRACATLCIAQTAAQLAPRISSLLPGTTVLVLESLPTFTSKSVQEEVARSGVSPSAQDSSRSGKTLEDADGVVPALITALESRKDVQVLFISSPEDPWSLCVLPHPPEKTPHAQLRQPGNPVRLTINGLSVLIANFNVTSPILNAVQPPLPPTVENIEWAIEELLSQRCLVPAAATEPLAVPGEWAFINAIPALLIARAPDGSILIYTPSTKPALTVASSCTVLCNNGKIKLSSQ